MKKALEKPMVEVIKFDANDDIVTCSGEFNPPTPPDHPGPHGPIGPHNPPGLPSPPGPHHKP